MARYAQLTATGIPSGVPVTIKQNGKQVSNLFPAADATAPDNRARTGTRSGALSPATFVPNGTYSVEWSGGGALSVTVSGAAGLPPAIPFDMATQAELDASGAGLAGAYAPRFARPVLAPLAPRPIRQALTVPTITEETVNGIASSRQVNASPTSPFVRMFAGGGFTNNSGANGYTASYRQPIGFDRDPFSAEVIHDGTDVSFRVTSAPGHYYRFWVNDELITGWDGVAGPGGGAIRNLRLTFPSVAERRIRLDMVGGDLWAVLCGGNDTIRATSPRGPRVYVMADSYAGGAGSPPSGYSGLSSWSSYFAALMGWDDVLNGGIGGTGWITRNASQTNNYEDRVATDLANAAAETNGLDVVIFQGGKNDFSSGASAIGAAAGRTVAAARALLPRALIIVTGPVFPGGPTDGTADPTWGPIQTAIFSAVSGISNVLTVDTTTAPIFTGTGTTAATTGTGNGDVAIQSDAVHPTPRGSALLGYALAHGTLDKLAKAA